MRTLIISIFLLISFVTLSQEKKSVEALKIKEPLKIDGFLDEDVYKQVHPAKDFLQLEPYNGEPSFQPTEAFFFYDQAAIYVGVMLYDSSPDSIFNLLSGRDDIGMSDYFGVYFDPYNEGQLAYGFFITPSGVQSDIKAIKSNWDREDGNWDAVWQSETRITDNGWIVEMRIPYSALRFPDKEIQQWGLNMFRNIRRYSSNNSWNFIDREVSGFIHQQGELSGIKNIEPPLRLSFSPYVAGYAESKPDASSLDLLFKGGMDLKYGINESYTLDMMLIPDFGQIQSDDQRLNLSPFELYYGEKRQFFNEGTELFQRGDIFYSRRIGGGPKFSFEANDALRENEEIDYSPSSTQMVNATKVSGRGDNGLAVGVLNAMTLPSYAKLKDTISGDKRNVLIQPFTNYNVVAADRSLKNNSYISLINTNMALYENQYGANVTATEFQLRDKNKKYALSGQGAVSNKYDTVSATGGYAELQFAKNSGRFNYRIRQEYYSENYNPNDMGFLRRNNIMESSLSASYNINDPFFIFKEWGADIGYDYRRMINPNDISSSGFDMGTRFFFKNNYSIRAHGGVSFVQHDYFEARVPGYYYYQPWSIDGMIFVNSDRRKDFSVDARIGSSAYPDTDEHSTWVGIGTNLRIGQRLSFYYDINLDNNSNSRGFVDRTVNEDTVFFGKRDVQSIENELNLNISFTNKLSTSFRARHYWSGVDYKQYYQLQKKDGSLVDDDNFAGVDDVNYNTFNIDMVLNWNFAPGSELSLAWKNSIFDQQNQIINSYRSNMKNTWRASDFNSISLKILYYIDYNQIRRTRS